MSPKQVDKEQKRQQLATVALEVFSNKGFENSSVADIAKAAGIGKGTVYQYFENKEELIGWAISSWMELLENEIEKLVADKGDPAERLHQYARIGMQMFIDDDRAMRLFMRLTDLILHGNPLVQRLDLARRMMRAPRRYVTGLILEGVSAGLFRTEVARDAEKIAINFLAYLDGIGFHYYMSRDYLDLIEQVDFHVDNLLRSLRPEAP